MNKYVLKYNQIQKIRKNHTDSIISVILSEKVLTTTDANPEAKPIIRRAGINQ